MAKTKKAKKPKKKLEYAGITFDSSEEIRVHQWLEEAVTAGLVADFTYQPKTFTLCEATPMTRRRYKLLKRSPFIKFVERKVNKVGKYVYTPDYLITFTDDMLRYYPDCFLITPGEPLYIDVKGDFSSGRNNTSGITFGVKSAWVFHKHGAFIQKITPKTLFKKTWVAEASRYTPVRGDLVKEYTKDCYKTYEEAVEYRAMIEKLLTKESQ